jgi:4-diphosphocytidyl-2-C-methyl-D-erythritol kinase
MDSVLRRLTLRSHAKVNLNLRVTGTRPDGYHLLETVFQTLELHDALSLEAVEGPLALECAAPGVPTDERNLAWKAARLVWQASGRTGEPSGARVLIDKRIPAQGGLGGGSSNGAAALVGFDALWGAALGCERLVQLGRALGADVPFFLTGGTALGLGRGDEITPMADVAPCTVVLVFPPFGVSTPEAFAWYDQDARGGRVAAAPPAPAENAVGLRDGWRVPVFNDLQGPVASRHPEIDEACRRLRGEGAVVASMTGSGSTVFGLFDGDAPAFRAEAGLAAAGWRTAVTRTAARARARADASLREAG